MIKLTIKKGKEAKHMQITTVYDCDGDWRSKAKDYARYFVTNLTEKNHLFCFFSSKSLAYLWIYFICKLIFFLLQRTKVRPKTQVSETVVYFFNTLS